MFLGGENCVVGKGRGVWADAFAAVRRSYRGLGHSIGLYAALVGAACSREGIGPAYAALKSLCGSMTNFFGTPASNSP